MERFEAPVAIKSIHPLGRVSILLILQAVMIKYKEAFLTKTFTKTPQIVKAKTDFYKLNKKYST